MLHSLKNGFSLVELLIALGIIGIMAAFTVPKLLESPNSTLSSKQSAMAKDVTFMISSAYEQYRLVNATVPSTMKPSDLRAYMNYIAQDTSGTLIDAHPSAAARACDSTRPCIKLHNGGTLMFLDISPFGGTTTMHFTEFDFDPDGVNSGSTANGPSSSLQISLYYNGNIKTRGTVLPSSCTNSAGCTVNPNSAYDPTWFFGY